MTSERWFPLRHNRVLWEMIMAVVIMCAVGSSLPGSNSQVPVLPMALNVRQGQSANVMGLPMSKLSSQLERQKGLWQKGAVQPPQPVQSIAAQLSTPLTVNSPPRMLYMKRTQWQQSSPAQTSSATLGYRPLRRATVETGLGRQASPRSQAMLELGGRMEPATRKEGQPMGTTGAIDSTPFQQGQRQLMEDLRQHMLSHVQKGSDEEEATQGRPSGGKVAIVLPQEPNMREKPDLTGPIETEGGGGLVTETLVGTSHKYGSTAKQPKLSNAASHQLYKFIFGPGAPGQSHDHDIQARAKPLQILTKGRGKGKQAFPGTPSSSKGRKKKKKEKEKPWKNALMGMRLPSRLFKGKGKGKSKAALVGTSRMHVWKSSPILGAGVTSPARLPARLRALLGAGVTSPARLRALRSRLLRQAEAQKKRREEEASRQAEAQKKRREVAEAHTHGLVSPPRWTAAQQKQALLLRHLSTGDRNAVLGALPSRQRRGVDDALKALRGTSPQVHRASPATFGKGRRKWGAGTADVKMAATRTPRRWARPIQESRQAAPQGLMQDSTEGNAHHSAMLKGQGTGAVGLVVGLSSRKADRLSRPSFENLLSKGPDVLPLADSPLGEDESKGLMGPAESPRTYPPMQADTKPQSAFTTGMPRVPDIGDDLGAAAEEAIGSAKALLAKDNHYGGDQ